MQITLGNAPGVSSVHLNLVARKAIVQVKTGEATGDELVDAVADGNGILSYSVTVVSG